MLTTITNKVTFARQLYYLTQPIVFTLIIIGFCLLFGRWAKVAQIGATLPFLLFVFPALIVHIQYLVRNWHTTLTIDKSQGQIVFAKRNTVYKDSIENIRKIVRTSSNITYRQPLFNDYFYYEIVFDNANTIVITCLLCDNLEALLIPVIHAPFDEKKKLFPII